MSDRKLNLIRGHCHHDRREKVSGMAAFSAVGLDGVGLFSVLDVVAVSQITAYLTLTYRCQ